MKEKIVNNIKMLIAKGDLKRSIEVLSQSIYEIGEFQDVDFRDLIRDFYFFEKKELLGEFTLREKADEENSLVRKLIKKLNKYIKKPFIYLGLTDEEIVILKNHLSQGRTRETIEILLFQENLPLVLKDRIIKISFEYNQIESQLRQGITTRNEMYHFSNKISLNLIKILESLTNIDTYKYYNENPLVFVIISFDEQMDEIYETIKEVGEFFNLEPVRVKDVVGDFRITNKIIDLIRKSKFVIADLSLEKPNVYFELGFARGIDKEIITICNQATKIHFDVKDWTCLYYSDSQNLKINLRTRFELQIENGE